MTRETDQCVDNRRRNTGAQGGGAVYGLGFIGAMVYFMQRSSSFKEGALGFGQAVVWPAILVYKMLEFFKVR
jgi:hypothetical protein